MYLITYTNNVKHGSAKMFIIRINPDKKDDKALLAHEIEHVKQWYTGLILSLIPASYCVLNSLYEWAFLSVAIGASFHGLIYKFIPKYRLWCEVQAYKKQLELLPDGLEERVAEIITTDYNLDITQQEALRLLKT